MSDYTPTTEEVRDSYIEDEFGIPREFHLLPEFNRWLRQVKADAWDAAVEALDRHYGDLSGLDRIVQDLDELNPYRETGAL